MRDGNLTKKNMRPKHRHCCLWIRSSTKQAVVTDQCTAGQRAPPNTCKLVSQLGFAEAGSNGTLTYHLLYQNIPFSTITPALAFLLILEHQLSVSDQQYNESRSRLFPKVDTRRESEPHRAITIINCRTLGQEYEPDGKDVLGSRRYAKTNMPGVQSFMKMANRRL